MSEKRFLHIMPDDKFIDYFIEQSEQIAPGASEYWVRTKEESMPTHVNSNKVKYFKWNDDSIKVLINQTGFIKRLILHSFKLDMLRFITQLDSSVHITWLFWGGEGYKYIYPQTKWLLPETLKVQQDLASDSVNWIQGIYRKKRLWEIVDSWKTRRMLKRINCCATWVKHDYEMVKHINPDMVWKDYSYYTIDQLHLDDVEICENNYSNIWIGNSAGLTNNHIDAMKVLKQENWEGKIYMPLSYVGSKRYIQKVIKVGEKLFGSQFFPIQKFMPLQEYQNLLNQCGHVWMNHMRQQGAGNVLAALYMGKAVTMHPLSNLYKTLKSWGLTLFTDYKNVDESKTSYDFINLNRQIVGEKLSYQHATTCIGNIYLS